MKTYTTIAPARIASGRLALSPSQADSRRHALLNVGPGLFEIIGPVEFKVGETFGYDQELPRALVACLEESDCSLEDFEQPELLAMAKSLGLNPHPNTGKPKLLEAIKSEMAAQEMAAKKAECIAKLEALGSAATEEEMAELASLKA